MNIRIPKHLEDLNQKQNRYFSERGIYLGLILALLSNFLIALVVLKYKEFISENFYPFFISTIIIFFIFFIIIFTLFRSAKKDLILKETDIICRSITEQMEGRENPKNPHAH